ncbi:uncharacterized protein PADG_07823 [Paracoccidioides brasiliensis Pb18]|uniref:Uncharacterized protein n=1 Tax=Paracoccidioides brasiliensis (strain Pb18) TaxID=502780 RepID=C1GKN7_PARBD|nr:uncharacterized protein PADG_07823 [Paracoccidioides brasiliensis Pb18]EEH43003.2 hypothetical protein PADG_07823 [Paracoccidioides brasiliensis Pb18]ODH45504.1 hypothetical protein GX48_08418 [Paracoccidioides brasiliensis]
MLHRRFDELETAFFMQDFKSGNSSQAPPTPHHRTPTNHYPENLFILSISSPTSRRIFSGSCIRLARAFFNRIQPEMCNFDEIPLLYGEPCGRILQALSIKQWMILDLYLSSLLTQARCPKSFQSWLGFLGEYIV